MPALNMITTHSTGLSYSLKSDVPTNEVKRMPSHNRLVNYNKDRLRRFRSFRHRAGHKRL